MEATIWRFWASAANSWGLHASTGRPESAGGVQASAIIWTICSALKVGGVPRRGASAKTSAIVVRNACSSVSATANCASAAAQRAPLAYGFRRTAEVLGQRLVALAGGGGEDNAGAEGESLGTGGLPEQVFEHCLLRWRDGNGDGVRTSHKYNFWKTNQQGAGTSRTLYHTITRHGLPRGCTSVA